MPPPETLTSSAPAPTSAPRRASVSTIVERLAEELSVLGAGPLAELRRMAPGGPGTAAFWHLARQCGFLEEVTTTDRWMRIVKILALLTPKGQPAETHRLHDPSHGLGEVLCDGGDPEWHKAGPDARPLLSERRLARLLSVSPNQLVEGEMERLARMIAARRPPDRGLNGTDIAWLVLSDDPRTRQRLARDYYRRLDQAARTKTDPASPKPASPKDETP